VLKKIELTNFKGFQKAEIDFGLVTVLIGPNGTGKSSIWQSLMLLRQSMGTSQLRVQGPLINLGDFTKVLNKESSRAEMELALSCSLEEDYPAIGIHNDALFSYHSTLNPSVVSYDATISTAQGKKFSTRKLPDQDAVIDPATFEIKSGTVTQATLNFGSRPDIATPFYVQNLVLERGATSVARTYQKEALSLFATLDTVLKNTYYVPAIRGLELPDYPLSSNYSLDIEPNAYAQVASTFAYAGKDIEKTVSRWCEDITGSAIGAEMVPDRRVRIYSEVVPGGIPIVCDGFGTNQLVHLLLKLASTPNQSVIAIEEPEIHLHPKAQKKLCNIILQVAKTSRKQIVITTHSQYVLFSFVSAVRENRMSINELSMYYFAEKGQPQRIEQDQHGDIYDWGRNFFDYS
jgi:energy-coupling factor transporter ATP-binding protein EcfA2